MKRINIVLDRDLLKALDIAACQTKRSRSALVRDVLRTYLENLGIRDLEERDRKGYLRYPQTIDELRWEKEIVLPLNYP
jgi:metal-responsive CopG/Arc/MetJ family transcriptional regulator